MGQEILGASCGKNRSPFIFIAVLHNANAINTKYEYKLSNSSGFKLQNKCVALGKRIMKNKFQINVENKKNI